MVKNVPTAKITYLSPLKGPSGKAAAGAQSGIDRRVIIPKTSKNAEHVVKWINTTLQEDIFKEFVLGEEGKLIKSRMDSIYR